MCTCVSCLTWKDNVFDLFHKGHAAYDNGLTSKVFSRSSRLKATKLCPTGLNVCFNISLSCLWSQLHAPPTSSSLTNPICITNN